MRSFSAPPEYVVIVGRSNLHSREINCVRRNAPHCAARVVEFETIHSHTNTPNHPDRLLELTINVKHLLYRRRSPCCCCCSGHPRLELFLEALPSSERRDRTLFQSLCFTRLCDAYAVNRFVDAFPRAQRRSLQRWRLCTQPAIHELSGVRTTSYARASIEVLLASVRFVVLLSMS